MLQEILDKYINPEVSNSLKIHTNSQMRECIIETFKLIVEDISELIINNKFDIDNSNFPQDKVLDILENYYEEQL